MPSVKLTESSEHLRAFFEKHDIDLFEQMKYLNRLDLSKGAIDLVRRLAPARFWFRKNRSIRKRFILSVGETARYASPSTGRN